MRRLAYSLVAALLIATLALPFVVDAQTATLIPPSATRYPAHITSATTTTIVTNPGGGATLAVWALYVTVDTGGAQTTITIQDSSGTNLVGTNMTYPVGPGATLKFSPMGVPHFSTGANNSLQIVTSAGGPVEVVAWVR